MKILVLSPFPPRRDAAHGGARSIAGLTWRLAEVHQVGLLALRGPDEEPTEPELADRCEFVVEAERKPVRTSPARAWEERQRLAMTAAGAPGWAVGFSVRAFSRALDRVLDDWDPDVVQIEFAVMAQYASRIEGRPLVVVDHDPSDNSRAMRGFRATALRRADAVVAFTQDDCAAIASLVPGVRVERIPLAVDVPESPLDPVGNGRDVVFVGNFMHPPNVDAAERLCTAIFPRVASKRPDARLVLVGADPPKSLRELASTNVAVTGRVRDLRPLLDAAAVVAAPLTRGGGMRVKVLDALAAGKALVATPRALAGVEVHSGEHAIVEEEDAPFADAIVMLLDDEKRRAAIATAARAWAETHLDWQRTAAAYSTLYESLLES
jgi:glycosyltransferase involved in cell wall biosynthesis